MKSTFDKEKFTLYRYQAETNIIVAVAAEYIPKLNHALKKFGSFKEVPSDWEVSGISIDRTRSNKIKFDEDAWQTVILINCLADYKHA